MMPFSGIDLASWILPIVAAVVGVSVLSGTRPVWPEEVPVAMASDGLLMEGARQRTAPAANSGWREHLPRHR